MGFFSNSEKHGDGSTTERFDTGSVTRNSDGSVRESTNHQIMLTGATAAVTRDGNGEIINAQWVKE